MNNSNISKDHIALEAMKVLMQISAKDNTPFWGRILRFFGRGDEKISVISTAYVAENAYEYADAMIAERERRNNKED